MRRKIKIYSTTDNIIYSCEYATMKECVERAVSEKVSLTYANLSYADLRGIDLSGADLQYANLIGTSLNYAIFNGAKNIPNLPMDIPSE